MSETTSENKPKNVLTIAGGIVLAAIIIAIAIIYSIGSKNQPNTNNQNTDNNSSSSQTIDLSGATFLGKADAPYTIVEFGDFQCSACVQFFGTVEPQIKSQFIDTGKAKMAFKILTFIDSYAGTQKGESWRSGLAAECAADQGKFWNLYNAVYSAELAEVQAGKQQENSGNLTQSFFQNWASQNGLDVNSFMSCLTSEKYAYKLQQYMNDAQKAMGNRISTPTIFIVDNKSGKAVKLDKYQDSPFNLGEYSEIIK